jgi:indolepyruvate ferredoxin oxidoreductase beta subunit
LSVWSSKVKSETRNVEGPLNLIIAGVGGQGNIFASQVIAQAALQEGFSVRIAETYGVTQRGGPVYSQVRIGHQVYGPLIPKGRCDLILGLEPIETLRRAAEYLAPGGSVAINTRVDVPIEAKLGRQPNLSFETIREELERLGVGELLAVDARAMAEQAGGAASMNVFMMGTLFGFDVFSLSYDSVEEAVRTITRSRFLEGNLLSLARGREYALSVKVGRIEVDVPKI